MPVDCGPCPVCGETVWKRFVNENKQTCSKECGNILRKRMALETRICAFCDADFETKKSSKQRYCNKVCSKAAQQAARVFIICEGCGVEFDVQQSRGDQRFCSWECIKANGQVGRPVGITEQRIIDVKEELIRLYVEEGITLYRAALMVDIHESTGRDILKSNNIRIRTTAEQQAQRTTEDQVLINNTISETKLSPEFQDKLRADNLAKYGRVHYKQLHLPEATVDILASKDALESYVLKTGIKNVATLHTDLGCGYSTLERNLKKYNLWGMMDHFTSLPELEVGAVLKSWDILYAKNQKLIAPYEIDLYVDDLKIGIEFNGDYWHSEEHKRPDYHQKKSLKARDKGVFIYHIFEYEWNDQDKRAKIINQMRNLFGKNERKIAARKCVIRDLEIAECRDFLDVNHLQGADRSLVKLGLFYEDELVSVMTFCKPRFNEAYQWELSRYCSISNTNVLGGAKRLFKHFLKTSQPTSVLSYADIAKTRGGLYETLGFTLDHISNPNYIWTDLNGKTLSRYQTQMKDEIATMRAQGMVRIHDSGNQVWVMDLTSSVL